MVSPTLTEIIDTRASRGWMLEDNIMMVEFKPNVELDKIDIEDLYNTLKILSNEKVLLLLVDISRIKSVTKEARDYAGSGVFDEVRSAAAIIVNSPVSRMILNLFLRLNPADRPAEMFTNKEKAIEWLKQI